ncbi:MAG: hypothetical protein ACLUVC_04680 [Longibaculum sp.]
MKKYIKILLWIFLFPIMLLFFLNDKMFDFITKHYNVENTKKKKYLFFLLWFLILGGLTKIFFQI